MLTQYIKNQILKESKNIKNAIFVFIGIESYVNIEEFSNHIIDRDTFGIDGNNIFFDNNWFTKVFTALNMVVGKGEDFYSILSFAQFSYLINYINPEFFKDRLVLLSDGFRSILPIEKQYYIEKTSDENIEERSENMPRYMAEQMQINDDYYYTIKHPIEQYKHIHVFEEKIALTALPNNDNLAVIDIVSDPLGLDVFINNCLKEQDFHKKILVKFFKKQPLKQQSLDMLAKVNWLLHLFGGELYELDEKAIDEKFKPSEETAQLLRQYWGDDASFRELKVYKNPDFDKEIISISQGQIVETLINEYKNAKEGNNVKDIFLTAPTGAGKSLLFQLPAFYVSAHGDVTIVVSPLIALMNDQVNQIHTERNFRKVHFINSDLTLIDRNKVIEECKNGEIDILYLSPELLLSYDISFFIGDRKLGLLVIDEAHLITTWGRDFRVDYWFLGQHVNKIRKTCGYKFPMIAVTATAIYGGDNDMVFDNINSLYMHDPHIFIGEVKRENITFVIDNHDKYPSNYDSEKEKETVDFITKISGEKVKTIVYAPYRRHIDRIQQRLNADGKGELAVSYHSGLSTDDKNFAYQRYKSGERNIMIATKAFGMGVDIADIQMVYHHAPSGLLPDYVQEIGRAARKKEINGFAALSYAMEDQRYSRKLHGMSALRQYQLREVLNKINKLFIINSKKRNMLVSSDDFSYIFTDTQDLDQKVLTALMMIEKDYLAKFRFNVLIARPKKLFTKVFCRVNRYGKEYMKKYYADCYHKLYDETDDYSIVELDLDVIWKKSFQNQSFPQTKKAFFDGKLFKDEKVYCRPQIKVSITLEDIFDSANYQLNSILDACQKAFSSLTGHFFKKEELKAALEESIPDKKIRDNIVKFMLASYSKSFLKSKADQKDLFLQSRRNMESDEEYRVLSSQYAYNFAQLKKRFMQLFAESNKNTVNRYTAYDSEYLTNYIRLGSILEIIGVGSYETIGGENPMIFIRINDPLRIERDAHDNGYRNSLLTNIESRYRTSTELFDHFFLHSFENEDRWNFIEDFFLGEANEELFKKYPGGERSHTDIIDYVRNHKNEVYDGQEKQATSTIETDIFKPKENGYYTGESLLKINGVTKKVNRWLIDNPVELDKVRRKYSLRIPSEIYSVLMSKLSHEHFSYLRDSLGLKLKIDFPGYSQKVSASIPYRDDPVKFYKWWKQNMTKVTLSHKETLELLFKVNEINPKVLIKKHRDLISNRR